MGRHRSLVLCALVACNPVFGIEETRGPDTDNDGLSDRDDNCVLAPNADQRDTDGDSLGDACDPCDGPQTGRDRDGDGFDDACDICPDGANHDEDGDGVSDGCDPCPGVPDAGEDADGDGVGDACDANPTAANTRRFFDGFGPQQPGWATWFEPPWIDVGDDLQPTSSISDGTWNFAGDVTGVGWWMEVDVVTPSLTSGEEFGLYVRERPDGSQIMFCYASSPGGSEWTANDYMSAPLTLGATTRFRIRYLGNGEVECLINGQRYATDPADIEGTSFVPNLSARRGVARFRWVDVVSEP